MNFGALYAKNSTVPQRDAAEYLTTYGHLLKWKNYKENVLEVGCGEGSITREILFPFLGSRVASLEAIDKLNSMIEFAKKENKEKEIVFKAIDINDKQYIASNEDKFDHIFSFLCIHWIVDTSSLLNAFYKMLKPNGQIFISTLTCSPLHRIYKKYSTGTKWSKYFPKGDYFANYTSNPEEYFRNALESIGFEVNLCKSEETKDGIIENYEDYSKSLVCMCDVLDHLPPKFREEYIKDHIKDFGEDCVYVEDLNKYKILYDPIIFIASKKT